MSDEQPQRGQNKSGSSKRRGNTSSNNKSTGNSKNNGASKGGSSRNRKRKGGGRNNNQKRFNPAEFWGHPDALPRIDELDSSPTSDTMAIVKSLGRAPVGNLPAEPYFALIYERAAGLATVLGHIPDTTSDNESPETA